jgi:AmiR/NasT family two-component response regulator
LNVYSRAENAFDEEARALGQLLAAQASVALKNAQVYAAARDLGEGLRVALESRDLIGQAKGILMEREGIDDATAFEMLKTISQHANVKLRDVARKVIDEKAAELGKLQQ